MRYSEFGKVQIFCRSCHKQTQGKLGDGVGPHFRAIHCEHCGKHSSEWLSHPEQSESPNPAVDNAVLIIKHQPKPEIQFDLFS